MRDVVLIVDALADAYARGEPAVLATVVHTEGATYRRAGARMLLRGGGRTTGAVSGGCLEADLAARVDDLLIARVPEVVTYDSRTSDDLAWVLGLGCNGRVDVLLEPLEREELSVLLALHERCRDLTSPAVVATVIGAAAGVQFTPRLRIGQRLMLTSRGRPASFGIAPGAARAAIIDDAREVLASGRSLVRHYGAGRDVLAGLDVFYEVANPPVSLLVCGGGADAVPLVRLAAQLGWRVTVVDHRPGWARPERFPGATVRLLPRDALSAGLPPGCDAAVVMTHDFELDAAHLRTLLASSLHYVGVLGPWRRTERMLEELELDPAAAARLHAPVGLDIGAETADEIALSIVAEVLAVKAGRSGSSLRERMGRIHDEPPAKHAQDGKAPRIGAVVLAAGASTRLGHPKQLVMYEGQPLVERAASAALRAGAAPVVVVVGAHSDAVGAALAECPVVLVENPAWADGLGSSVSAGVRALLDSAPEVEAVLLSLADQPLVDSRALGRLADAWRRCVADSPARHPHGTAIVAAAHSDTIGVPAIFGRASFEQLAALSGDGGAARLLRAAGARVRPVPMPEASIDVDTPAGLTRLGIRDPSPLVIPEEFACVR